jgi:hypothetical protein
MPGRGTGRSADFGGGFPDGLVDVLRFDVEFLGDVLLGLQRGLAGTGADVDEYRVGLRHAVSPVLTASG